MGPSRVYETTLSGAFITLPASCPRKLCYLLACLLASLLASLFACLLVCFVCLFLSLLAYFISLSLRLSATILPSPPFRGSNPSWAAARTPPSAIREKRHAARLFPSYLMQQLPAFVGLSSSSISLAEVPPEDVSALALGLALLSRPERCGQCRPTAGLPAQRA